MIVDKLKIVAVVQALSADLRKLGVHRIGLFGSFVREENDEDSDIDLLVSFRPDEERFDNLMELYDLFENAFRDKKVDVVTENGLSSYLGPEILKEVEYIDLDE